jgi:F0F1-type ATP synthase assembly protein I
MSRENLKSEDLKKNKEKKQIDSQWSVFSLAMELGYMIAIPIVAMALLGRFLDKKLETSPWFLLAGICVSILLTTYLVYKKTISVIDDQ